MGKEETLRKDYEAQLAKLTAEKNELFMQLQSEKNSLNTSEERTQKLNAQKADLERQVQVKPLISEGVILLFRNWQRSNLGQFLIKDLSEKLANQEERSADLTKAKKKAEQEIDGLKKQIQDLELALRKAESEKTSKDNQIRSLQVYLK